MSKVHVALDSDALFYGSAPMVKHQSSDTIYNSTLAKILVEYASAVSSFTFSLS
jgi:hypothetical protein